MSSSENLTKANKISPKKNELKIWSDVSKKIMEFALLNIKLYAEKYGVRSDWFSTDSKFSLQIELYTIQKSEIKEIVETF